MSKQRLTTEKQREAIGGVKGSFLNKLTPVQIDTYIENNVTDLASAKTVLKKIAKIVLYIAKQVGLQ